jgi:hypothetical protein
VAQNDDRVIAEFADAEHDGVVPLLGTILVLFIYQVKYLVNSNPVSGEFRGMLLGHGYTFRVLP